jgi:hypothetical protein
VKVILVLVMSDHHLHISCWRYIHLMLFVVMVRNVLVVVAIIVIFAIIVVMVLVMCLFFIHISRVGVTYT